MVWPLAGASVTVKLAVLMPLAVIGSAIRRIGDVQGRLAASISNRDCGRGMGPGARLRRAGLSQDQRERLDRL